MKTPILLHIPEPCHENWDAMTEADKGRHCQSCNKIVVDFSVMSDRQVLEYFKTTTGKTCGRFHDDQLQRPLVEPQTRPSRWNYFLASLLGFIISGKLAAQNRIIKGKVVGKPAVHRNTIKGETKAPTESVGAIKIVGDIAIIDSVNNPKDTIVKKEPIHSPFGSPVKIVCNANENIVSIDKMIGKVTDEKGTAIGGATIILKGTKIGIATDANGVFTMKKLGENNKLTLTISSIGFETKEIEVIPKSLNNNLTIVLKEKKNELKEIILIAPHNYTIGKYTMGGMSTVSYKKIDSTIKDTVIKKVQKIFNRESIKIYPNPARKDDIIHITIKAAGEYTLHFFDTQSRLLTVKSIVTNTNNQTTEFELPSTVAKGTYFIRILNETTQKQVTEKIIIQ